MLDFVDRFEPGSRARVLARFPAESLRALTDSSRTDWLPLEHDHHVVDGICEVLGPERAVAAWRASVPDLVDKPLLRSFVSGMLRLVGRDPVRLAGILAKGWPLVYRDCCVVTVTRGEGDSAVVALVDLAPELRRWPNYLLSFRGALAGFAVVAGLHPVVEVETTAGARGLRATYRAAR